MLNIHVKWFLKFVVEFGMKTAQHTKSISLSRQICNIMGFINLIMFSESISEIEISTKLHRSPG